MIKNYFHFIQNFELIKTFSSIQKRQTDEKKIFAFGHPENFFKHQKSPKIFFVVANLDLKKQKILKRKKP